MRRSAAHARCTKRRMPRVPQPPTSTQPDVRSAAGGERRRSAAARPCARRGCRRRRCRSARRAAARRARAVAGIGRQREVDEPLRREALLQERLADVARGDVDAIGSRRTRRGCARPGASSTSLRAGSDGAPRRGGARPGACASWPRRAQRAIAARDAAARNCASAWPLKAIRCSARGKPRGGVCVEVGHRTPACAHPGRSAAARARATPLRRGRSPAGVRARRRSPMRAARGAADAVARTARARSSASTIS